MEIKIEDLRDKKIISVVGEIDMHTSPELRKHLLKSVKDKFPIVIVDLKEVSYMDSSGIATLVEALKGMMKYKGSLRLCNLSERVKEIFTFAKLDKVFEIYKDLKDATSH
ncbi:MAG: STAS domain-containing protein [Thermodesulfovibrionales bacterium]|nr:STAS domain-containing protein [Thermodesulfovibrionales bacterium]